MRSPLVYAAFFALVVLLNSCSDAVPQPGSHSDLLSSLMEKHRVPGVQLVLFNQNEILTSLALGVCDVRTGDSLRTDTPMELASLSKPVFHYLVQQMLDSFMYDIPLRNLIDTTLAFQVPIEPGSRRLSDYLNLQHQHPEDWFWNITPMQMLTHQSGLGDHWKPEPKLLHPPGTKFYYSDEGYLLLQRIIEQRSGHSMQYLLDALISDELAPIRCFSRLNAATQSASGHDAKGAYKREILRSEEALAHGSLLASAEVYARFMQMLRSEGHFTRPEVQVSVQNNLYWTPGWGLERIGEELLFWHWGNNTYFQGYCGYFPGKEWGFVLYTNSNNGLKLVHEFIPKLLGYSLESTRWVLP